MSLTDKEFTPEPVADENGDLHKPETFEIGDPSTWKRISGKYCQAHNLIEDPSEKDFEALQCTRCPFKCLVRARVEAQQT